MHGRLELKTGDGSIRATDIAGQLTLSTGDGSVTLEDVARGPGRRHRRRQRQRGGQAHHREAAHRRRLDHVPRRGGDVDEGRLVDDDRRRRHRVYLPSDFGAELDAHTGDGSIRNELGLKAEADGKRSRPRSRPGPPHPEGQARRRRQAAAHPDRRRIDQIEDVVGAARRAAHSPNWCVRGTTSDRPRPPLETHPFAPGTCCTGHSATRPSAACTRASAPAARPARYPFRMTSALSCAANGASMAIRAPRPSDSARDIASKNAGVASGNGLPASVPSSSVTSFDSNCRPDRVDGRFREQDDVASVEVDVFVGRVERRRLAAHRPMRRRKHVGHVEPQDLDDPSNGGCANRRAAMASSSASHAKPTLT